MSINGRWRIVEMELWDREAIDLLGPAFIEIGPDGQGRFRFIAVVGWMDIRDPNETAAQSSSSRGKATTRTTPQAAGAGRHSPATAH